MKLKLRAVGTSTGVGSSEGIPRPAQVKRNDTLFAVETTDGYLLTPYAPEVEEDLKLGREFMAEYRDAFRALAK